jgi:aspartate beta-hydroxylase
MSMSAMEIQSLTQEAFKELQAGNHMIARNLFELITSEGQGDSNHWLGLAYACSSDSDDDVAFAAINQSLVQDPTNLRSNLFKADYLQQQKKTQEAIEFYQTVLKITANTPSLPDDIQQGVSRAEAACAAKNEQYQKFLLDRLTSEGFNPKQSNHFFRQSLDLMFGKKTIYFQEPRRYFYPGLPQIQFYEREQFDWVKAIEGQTDNIRAELTAVLNDKSKFSPYIKSDDSHLGQDNAGLEDSDDWSGLFLWNYGNIETDNAALFPKTMQALNLAPLPHIAAQSPMALFSKLSATTKIPPHNGLLNTRLICHLPLIVPKNCGALRVGNETRPWVEGEMLIFDDSIEHEAWNDSDEQRLVLIFEVWRPEISVEVQKLIKSTLEAAKDYNNM